MPSPRTRRCEASHRPVPRTREPVKEFVKGIPHRRDAEAPRRSKNSIEELCKGKATEQRGVKPTAYQKLHVPSDSRLLLSMSAFLRASAAKAIDFFTASDGTGRCRPCTLSCNGRECRKRQGARADGYRSVSLSIGEKPGGAREVASLCRCATASNSVASGYSVAALGGNSQGDDPDKLASCQKPPYISRSCSYTSKPSPACCSAQQLLGL